MGLDGVCCIITDFQYVNVSFDGRLQLCKNYYGETSNYFQLSSKKCICRLPTADILCSSALLRSWSKVDVTAIKSKSRLDGPFQTISRDIFIIMHRSASSARMKNIDERDDCSKWHVNEIERETSMILPDSQTNKNCVEEARTDMEASSMTWSLLQSRDSIAIHARLVTDYGTLYWLSKSTTHNWRYTLMTVELVFPE